MGANVLKLLPFDVMAFGRFDRDQLRLLSTTKVRPTNDSIEALIATEWTRRMREAQATGAVMFNGELLRYVSHRVIAGGAADDQDVFELAAGHTCYRDFVGTNLYNHHRLDEFGWERFSNPIGTTATLVSSDGLICYGRRSQRVAYHASHVHTLGGALEASDRTADGSVDPFGSVLRELKEEVNIEPRDLDEFVCVGLIRDKEIHQPELLFEGRLHLTAAELVERWRSADEAGEHVEIVTVRAAPEALVPFMLSCGPIAPVAIGAMFLYGWGRWGRSWFDDAARQWAAAST